MGLVVISSQEVSSGTTSVNFTSGIDSTYRVYEVHFTNMKHVYTTSQNDLLRWQADTGANTNYNQPIMASCFYSYNDETTGTSVFAGRNASAAGRNHTTYITLSVSGDNSDESSNGIFRLFDPSSTTFVKHFESDFSAYDEGDYAVHWLSGGFINTTSAINKLSFKFYYQPLDSGKITLYGVS